MNKSMFAQYAKEQGAEIIETDYGFATYYIKDTACYIEDIFVTKEKRRDGVASQLADMIMEKAKEAGCNVLTGTVNMRTGDPHRSLCVLLGYGFKLHSTSASSIVLSKEI